jgi:predicted RNA binding protein YcfA (HicA-like mRNA interferase family)
MPKLRPEKPGEVIRKLRRLGFEGPLSGGRHLVMRHPQTGKKISVPMHKGRDIPVGTLRAILREAGVDVEEWVKL